MKKNKNTLILIVIIITLIVITYYRSQNLEDNFIDEGDLVGIYSYLGNTESNQLIADVIKFELAQGDPKYQEIKEIISKYNAYPSIVLHLKKIFNHKSEKSDSIDIVIKQVNNLKIKFSNSIYVDNDGEVSLDSYEYDDEKKIYTSEKSKTYYVPNAEKMILEILEVLEIESGI